jgi:3-dehydroquinate synthase
VEAILEATHVQGIDRHSYIAAIGGGAVLDMVGFAAAIAHRGIRHIRIPTTVLSQNDSGVGVKNSFNYFNKKNYLGTFVPPVAVFNDFAFLTTLNDRDWRGGISEAVKVALIKDYAFFTFLEEHAEAMARREMPPMKEQVIWCAKLHMAHIAGGDPFELGSSRPLDFGHWAAHKMEQLTDYTLRHGEAVAIGIALDTVYSYLTQRLEKEAMQRVLNLFSTLGFALYHPVLEQEGKNGEWAILQGLQEFKEHLGGKLTIMLLRGLGKGEEVHEIDPETVKKAVGWLKNVPVAH